MKVPTLKAVGPQFVGAFRENSRDCVEQLITYRGQRSKVKEVKEVKLTSNFKQARKLIVAQAEKLTSIQAEKLKS